ncbi:hypothetical protein [Parendozoicomonas haliclonae]|uniref:Uncharacterized protein n=1 Tax=Parendozoicomonas haliclonae TaxID=1960125 RepID=A0A1X7APB7_9GAMM|nr:hypothetical protein [Parendozoicomonas haliclonae]SMA49086.1 hypothetical protein EHSB41UT_03042 [Parendozoicomonas haliclonae]
METLSMGGRFFKNEELELIEQRRLEALLDITTKHSEEVQGLKSKLEQAEGKSVKAADQIKVLDKEIKTLREHNPDRMKKQIKRLQDQNRAMTAENNTMKTKQKQLQQQLDAAKVELDKLKAEQTEAQAEPA